MNQAGKAVVNSSLKNANGALKSKSGINWTDFNYPPFIKVIHFNRQEVQEPHSGIAFKLWIVHAIIFLISIINLLNNIIQCAQGASGMRIIYSFVFFFLFNPLAGACFYRGLLAFLDDDEEFKIYKIMTGVLTLAYALFAIANFGNFNGFTRIGQVSGFSIVLCIIESILYIIAIIINCFLLQKAFKWEDGPAKLMSAQIALSSSTSRSQSSISEV